jgi:hypothetical protein
MKVTSVVQTFWDIVFPDPNFEPEDGENALSKKGNDISGNSGVLIRLSPAVAVNYYIATAIHLVSGDK